MFRKPKILHSFSQSCGEFSLYFRKHPIIKGFFPSEPVEKPVECVENSSGHNMLQQRKKLNYVNFCSVIFGCG